MKFENMVISIAISLLLVASVTASATAQELVSVVSCAKYTVDGDLSDWGPDITQDWSQEATWVPNSGVHFIVEDNRDPQYGGLTGVHIRGTGSSYVPYEEPKIQHNDGSWKVEPYGGEQYDMEALYLDEDENCVYVALVTSVKPDATGDDNRPGDIALNLDNDKNTGEYGYEYGVKLGDNYLTQFDIYSMPDWEESVYFPDVKPTIFKSGSSNVGSATGVYTDAGINDNGYTNYVAEVAIPKNLIGNPDDVHINDLWIADQCGNDYIPAPEFMFAAIPVAIIGMVLVFAHKSAKKRAI